MLSITEKKEEEENGLVTQQSPLYSFMYALKSSEARRQYPKRLKMLFDFLDLHGSIEEQAREFLCKSRQNVQWSQESIMIFVEFHKQRVRHKELAVGTLKNYYRAVRNSEKKPRLKHRTLESRKQEHQARTLLDDIYQQSCRQRC